MRARVCRGVRPWPSWSAASRQRCAAARRGRPPRRRRSRSRTPRPCGRCCKQRADVNAADVEGMTALHWAAHWNDLDTVEAPARRRRQGQRGEPLRRDAAARGRHGRQRARSSNALLSAGADANAAYGDGETPLMIAARTGSVEAVKLLLEARRQGQRRRAVPRPDGADAGRRREPRGGRQGALDAGRRRRTRARSSTHFQKLTGGAGGIIHDRPQGGLTALILAARQGALEAASVLIAARRRHERRPSRSTASPRCRPRSSTATTRSRSC